MPGDKKSLNNNQLYSIVPDPAQPDKYLWTGSNGGGFSRFEIATGTFINYNEKNGLPNNVVYAVRSDKAGNLWLSTNRGLSCFTPKNETMINYNSEDGLPGDEFNRYEYFKMTNGDLFFGGMEGGVVFNPEKVLEKEPAPAIVLTGLSVYNKPVTYKTDNEIIQSPISYASVITLPHSKGMFSISYAALEFRAANKKHYKYFLENYDKKWIDAGNKTEATYTNLALGNYTFHVIGAGSSTVWNTKGASIRIVILPAWYQTWWFRLSVLLIIAGGIYTLYRYRLAQQIKLFSIRNNIASDLHDEIGSTLSSISISSTLIQKKMEGNSTEVNGLLNQISNNTDNMMEAMSDIVWAINSKNDRFDNVVNRMRSFAIEILEPENIQLHMQVSEHLNHVKLNMQQRKNFYLIFKEAVNNIAKYAACTNVWVDIESKGGKIMMKIKDNGKDFSSASIKEDNRPQFGGNGLVNMYKRASELKGTIEIDSVVGQGTVVKLEFAV